MKLDELLSTAGETMTVRRVFGEPYEQDGTTVIPGAMVSGGGGGGGGHDEKGQQGEGGGFGMNARPVGAFVIREGKVVWRPAIDINRLLMVVGAVTVASLLAWARRQGRPPGRSRGGRMRLGRRRHLLARQGRRHREQRSRREHRGRDQQRGSRESAGRRASGR